MTRIERLQKRLEKLYIDAFLVTIMTTFSTSPVLT